MIIFSVEECVLSKWWWFTPCEWSPGSVYTPRLLPPPPTHTSAAQDLVAFHPHLVQGERFCSLQTHPHSPLLRFATVQWKEKILPHPWSTWPSTINSNNVVVSVSWVSLLHPCLILRLRLRIKLYPRISITVRVGVMKSTICLMHTSARCFIPKICTVSWPILLQEY